MTCVGFISLQRCPLGCVQQRHSHGIIVGGGGVVHDYLTSYGSDLATDGCKWEFKGKKNGLTCSD